MSIKQAIEALEVAQDALDISQSLQESAKSNHHPKTLAAYERVSAALAALRSMPQGEPVKKLALTQATAPRKIWLNLFGDSGTGCEPFPDDHEGVTWSDDEPGDFNVPYVRADLATAVRMSEAEIGRLWEINVGEPTQKYPFTQKDWINFARAVEQATAARLGVKMGDV